MSPVLHVNKGVPRHLGLTDPLTDILRQIASYTLCCVLGHFLLMWGVHVFGPLPLDKELPILLRGFYETSPEPEPCCFKLPFRKVVVGGKVNVTDSGLMRLEDVDVVPNPRFLTPVVGLETGYQSVEHLGHTTPRLDGTPFVHRGRGCQGVHILEPKLDARLDDAALQVFSPFWTTGLTRPVVAGIEKGPVFDVVLEVRLSKATRLG